MSETTTEPKVIIKGWHALAIVGSIIITVTLAYGTVADQTKRNTDEINELKQKALTRELYEAGQDSLEKRLDRIERKVDDLDLREWKKEAETAKPKK